jgi:hypothetical protein
MDKSTEAFKNWAGDDWDKQRMEDCWIAATKAERERCAKICESIKRYDAAYAIRERGE